MRTVHILAKRDPDEALCGADVSTAPNLAARWSEGEDASLFFLTKGDELCPACNLIHHNEPENTYVWSFRSSVEFEPG